jgi:N-acetylglucosamine malate deacetylase 1
MKAGEMEFTSYLQTLASPFHAHPVIQKPSHPFVVMILSPHPDDESIVGSLALRLLQENGAHVINVAVTLGSKKDRQKARLKELTAACDLLEFELAVLSEDWAVKLKELKSLIQKYQPHLILAPHLEDFHPTHIKTGKLLDKAIKALKFPCLVAWSEFWGAIKKPNLLIEVPTEIVELQMKALLEHEGEISRNPYHLRLPAWMMDNVRRGGEIITSPGSDVPKAAFGVIYHLQKFKNGKATKLTVPPYLSALADMAQIFSEMLEPAAGSKTKVK